MWQLSRYTDVIHGVEGENLKLSSFSSARGAKTLFLVSSDRLFFFLFFLPFG